MRIRAAQMMTIMSQGMMMHLMMTATAYLRAREVARIPISTFHARSAKARSATAVA